MAAGSTYTPIATYTAPSAQTNVTFSSIASTYTDLVLVIAGTLVGTGTNFIANVNGDSGSNYSYTYMAGNGSVTESGRASSQSRFDIGYQPTYGTQGNILLNFYNYSNTTTYKTITSRSNQASSGTYAYVGLWRSTSAINQIVIGTTGSAGNIATGSTFTLYGIAAA
jgi:hypothetical protein